MTSTSTIVAEIKRIKAEAFEREIELIYKLRRYTPMSQIAQLLNIDRKTLYNKIKKYESEQRSRKSTGEITVAGQDPASIVVSSAKEESRRRS